MRAVRLAAGCGEVLPDGSFVTTKTLPGNYAVAWETKGLNSDLLDSVHFDMGHPRGVIEAKYLGDLFPASASAAPGVLFRDFFSRDRNGVRNGIVLIDLGSLP